jgi:hypothetical protein
MSPEYYSRVPKYFILSGIPYTWLCPLLKNHLALKFENKTLLSTDTIEIKAY